ncbi:LOW QUALITY PROTEIN: transport and Golgi organization protein 6 homolog [Mercenaria mercenaria]|uniref:LOW QUALITY PROTEIN: transport and Golgi organization protein 6 homolog n=1 Tax=Mercenaria mercenaria TaxID=6596 RepID=UPI00234F60F4|nr:LOW QUALITY PROTEIN: transport and Golgi organization protein 6 homolog [Mercenaria mercenaria]
MAEHTVTEVLDPSLVISALQILTTASAGGHSSSRDLNAALKLDEILLANVVKLESVLKSDASFKKLLIWWNSDTAVVIPPECSSRWRYVLYCLKTLHLLQVSICGSLDAYNKTATSEVKEIKAPKMTPDTLSFNEQKLVKGATQFIVCLGICPCLHKGVGIPLELRSGFCALVKMAEDKETISEQERNVQLFCCMKVLMSCVTNPALGTLILTQHLVDILAALFQLAHIGKQRDLHKSNISSESSENGQGADNSQVEKSKENVREEESFQNMNPATIVDFVRAQFDESKMMMINKIAEKDHERSKTDNGADTKGKSEEIVDKIDFKYCEKCLEDLLVKVYPPLLVKTLMLLQGGPKTKAPQCQNAPVLQQAPKWLRQECGRRLTAVMMMPKGVQSVLRGMLDAPGMGKGMTEANDWRKCDAVAKVIACCPVQSLSIEEYYRKVAPQILELLHIQDRQVCRQFLRVACSTISSMASQQPDLTQKCLIQPMLKPLTKCLDREGTDVAMTTSGITVVEETQFTQCLEDCHKVFVFGCVDNPQLVTHLQPVILTLYELFVFMKPGISALKATCQELIVTFLKNADIQVTLTCLQLMAFQQTTSHNEAAFPRMHHCLKFVNGNNGGVVVQTDFNESVSDSSQDMNVECIVALLKDLQNTSVPGEFLVFMLKELTQFIQTEVEGEESAVQDQASTRSQGDQALLDIEQRNQTKIDQFYRKLTLLNILAAVCETLGPDCIKNAKHTLEFVKATLERGVQICNRTEDMVFEAFENETVTMAMGLLTALLTGAFQLTSEDRKAMQELLPLLQEISSEHPESSVQEMATDIRIAIATHGAVWSEMSKEKGQNFEEISRKINEEKKKVKKPLDKTAQKIEIISENKIPKPEADHSRNVSDKTDNDFKAERIASNEQKPLSERGPNETNKKLDVEVSTDRKQELQRLEKLLPSSDSKKPFANQGDDGDVKSELDLAFKELCDTLIPVRGHGLIRLTHLVQNRDVEVKKRHAAVLKIFEENLDHGDSYIYLSAVNGLAAMCDMYPDLVVPMVCKQFADFNKSERPNDNKKRSPELRMKLGEVMVKASRCLGDTIPKYRDLLLSSIMTGVRDEEAFIRASSLSNLGEMCKMLKFSLGNIIHEVFECCSSTLKHDKDVEVRKAAAQALTLLLQGTGQQVFKILDTVLKDLYRLLKHVMQVEKEEGVKLHVHLALNELDDLMKEHLFPKQKLEKKIKVLDFD